MATTVDNTRLHSYRHLEVTAMDGFAALKASSAEFERRLRLVRAEDWTRPTPCSEWDVRALVNHVIGANIRYTMLLRGADAGAVDATRSDDHIGDDAVASFTTTAATMLAAFEAPGALDRIYHHPVGDRTGRELLSMRALDSAVHAWDLAQALVVDSELDPGLAEFALAYVPHMTLGRAFASPLGAPPPSSNAQPQLLHLLGRHPDPVEEVTMSEVDAFLEEVLPQLRVTEFAIHNGDAGPRKEMWSHEDPVTLFGAAFSGTGWSTVDQIFDNLAASMSNCVSCEWEVVAAGASGDLGYIVAIERSHVSIDGEPREYALRSTTVLRREGGAWKVVHRHGDPYDEARAPIVSQRESLNADTAYLSERVQVGQRRT